jgi:hypothetical protein
MCIQALNFQSGTIRFVAERERRPTRTHFHSVFLSRAEVPQWNCLLQLFVAQERMTHELGVKADAMEKYCNLMAFCPHLSY